MEKSVRGAGLGPRRGGGGGGPVPPQFPSPHTYVKLQLEQSSYSLSYWCLATFITSNTNLFSLGMNYYVVLPHHSMLVAN